METIAIFQEVFGDHFWTNACVVVTHFSRSPEQEEIRLAQGITKKSKKEAILNAIKEMFPKSKEYRNDEDLPVFFTDVFDLSRSWDKTRTEARKIVKLAQESIHYDTTTMRKCPCAQWRDLKDRINSMYLQMCNDPLIKKL